MSQGFGLGPVFAYEWLTSARRWQMYAWRSFFILLFLLAFLLAWFSARSDPSTGQFRHHLADIGERSFYCIFSTLLSLVILVAPATTAGAICQEKARGTFLFLLTTHLTDAEIVYGKLAARLVPVLMMVASSVPVLFLATLLGGIDPEALYGAFLVIFSVALVAGSFTMLLSIWGNKTYEVIIAAYLLALLVVLGPIMIRAGNDYLPLGLLLGDPTGALPAWLDLVNPYWLVFAPYSDPGATSLQDCYWFLGWSAALSASFLALAWWRLRPAVLKQAARRTRRPTAWRQFLGELNLSSANLDKNPMLWWELHRCRPSAWLTVTWLVYGGGAFLFTLIAAEQAFSKTGFTEVPSIVAAVQVTVGLLLVSVSSVTVLAEERGGGGIDAILTTPVATRTIVWNKWRGAYQIIPKITLLPSLVALLVAFRADGNYGQAALVMGLALTYGAALTSSGLLLATWISRFGRALAANVAIFVATLIVPPAIGITLQSYNNDWVMGVVCGSPFYGVGIGTSQLPDRGDPELQVVVYWMVFWLVFYFAVALALYLLTLLTFDRCFGRMRDGGRRRAKPGQAPPAPGSPSPAIPLPADVC